MIGISFEIPNKYGKFLNNILDNIELEKYLWNIYDSEVLNKEGKNIFYNNIYNNKHIMKDNEDYYLIFANIQGCRKNSNRITIKSYQDFIKSNCEILIIIVDSIFVDFYAKDENILKIVKNNIKKYNFKNEKILKNIEDTIRSFNFTE